MRNLDDQAQRGLEEKIQVESSPYWLIFAVHPHLVISEIILYYTIIQNQIRVHKEEMEKILQHANEVNFVDHHTCLFLRVPMFIANV